MLSAARDPQIVEPHLVVLGAKDETELKALLFYLQNLPLVVHPWHEDDLDNQLTAISTGPIPGDSPQRQWLRHLKLLK